MAGLLCHIIKTLLLLSNQIIPVSSSVSWRTGWYPPYPCLPCWPVRPGLTVQGVGGTDSGRPRPGRTGGSSLVSCSSAWLWPRSFSSPRDSYSASCFLAYICSSSFLSPLPLPSPSVSLSLGAGLVQDLTCPFPVFLAFLPPSPSHVSVGAVARSPPHYPQVPAGSFPASPLTPRSPLAGSHQTDPWGGPLPSQRSPFPGGSLAGLAPTAKSLHPLLAHIGCRLVLPLGLCTCPFHPANPVPAQLTSKSLPDREPSPPTGLSQLSSL